MRVLAAGTQVAGRYRIESLIAKGGMVAVYIATDVANGKRVALKRRTGTRPRDARMYITGARALDPSSAQ